MTGTIIQKDNDAAKRLQTWVDRLHSKLQADLPHLVRHTPKPRVVIVRSKEPNAWVTWLPVCLGVPMTIQTPAMNPSLSEIETGYLHGHRVSVGPIRWPGGVQSPACAGDAKNIVLKDYVAAYNSRPRPCHLDVKGTALEVTGSDCKFYL